MRGLYPSFFLNLKSLISLFLATLYFLFYARKMNGLAGLPAIELPRMCRGCFSVLCWERRETERGRRHYYIIKKDNLCRCTAMRGRFSDKKASRVGRERFRCKETNFCHYREFCSVYLIRLIWATFSGSESDAYTCKRRRQLKWRVLEASRFRANSGLSAPRWIILPRWTTKEQTSEGTSRGITLLFPVITRRACRFIADRHEFARFSPGNRREWNYWRGILCAASNSLLLPVLSSFRIGSCFSIIILYCRLIRISFSQHAT